MKKLFLLTILLCDGLLAFSQSKMACCKQSATQQFAMLASDKSFRMSHKIRQNFTFKAVSARPSLTKLPAVRMPNAYILMAKNPTNNYILVVHEWWGLNDFVKAESEKIYNALGNVNVIDLDLYDGKVATTRDDAGKYMQSVTDDRAKAIINGAITYVGLKAHIATIGWCFGGGWSLQSALLAGKQTVACVMYYGMPEQDVNRLKTLNCDVLGNFANKDQWINPKVVAKFADDMKTAGKKLYVHQYDADHGFANPSSPIYNSDATKEAYRYTIEFLKARLR